MFYFFSPFLTGLSLGASLIIAIGAQNIFILRQGLKNEHILPIVLFCSCTDAIMITAGVSGVGHFVQTIPYFSILLSYGGALFLIWQGITAVKRILKNTASLSFSTEHSNSLKQCMIMTAGFTLLNPHLYIDTIILMGSVSINQPLATRPIFTLGAIAASFIWFPFIGYGARTLKPIFSRALSWKILDAITAIIMLTLAAILIYKLS